MKISQDAWKSYIDQLSKINNKAAEKVAEFYRAHPNVEMEELISYAYSVANYYGEAAGELACEMYDAVASTAPRVIPSAESAATATYGEIAQAIQGAMLRTNDPDAIGSVVGRKVKTVGLDSLINNSLRDGAEFAWIPSGDTCPFCMMLASNGWQRASKKALKHGHASHVHNNCDCTYAIRFDHDTEVEGYDPDYYKRLYDEAEGDNWKQKVNAMRRDYYAAHRDRINAQKREAYAMRKTLANIQQNDIIMTRVGVNYEILNPMDREEYFKWVDRLKNNGITVIQAKGDDLSYLITVGAEASYSQGFIIHIGDVPSRATLLEEIIHSTQAKVYGELATTDPAERAAREIAANRMLLKYRRAYNLDEIDIADTERNLRYWEVLFKKTTGVSYDRSSIKREI